MARSEAVRNASALSQEHSSPKEMCHEALMVLWTRICFDILEILPQMRHEHQTSSMLFGDEHHRCWPDVCRTPSKQARNVVYDSHLFKIESNSNPEFFFLFFETNMFGCVSPLFSLPLIGFCRDCVAYFLLNSPTSTISPALLFVLHVFRLFDEDPNMLIRLLIAVQKPTFAQFVSTNCALFFLRQRRNTKKPINRNALNS